MMDIKISIICPVYKAEQYIHRCIDSVINQTLQEWELLLIDDGSPDNCGIICDEYASKDSRIRVIHKENGGVGSARQTGLEVATGQFLIHVDPDDWIEPSMLEKLYDKAIISHADMVICDYFVDINNSSNYVKQKPATDNPNDVLKELFGNLHGSCCNKLVKRATCLKYEVYFPKGINYCEDVCFNVQLLMHNIKVVYLPEAFYHYFQVSTSITNSFSKLKLETCIKYIEWLCSILSNQSSEVMKAKEMVKINAVNFAILPNAEIKKLYPEIKNYTTNKLHIRLAYFLAFRGYQRIGRFILKLTNEIAKIRNIIFR